MKYSFVVPIYNIQDKLGQCIDSLINQECKDASFEIVLVDDGSTDSSGSICDYYAKLNNQIKVVHKLNGGLTSSRKAGAALASGDYIIPVDGDDYVDPGYLDYINGIVSRYNPDMIAMSYYENSNSGIRMINNDATEGLYTNHSLNRLKQSYIYDFNKRGSNYGCLIYSLWTKIVKRELYCKSQMSIPNHIKLGEDLLVNTIIINSLNSIYVSNRAYYHYRISTNSMIHKYDDSSFGHYNNLVVELNKTGLVHENTIRAYAAMMLINQVSAIVDNCENAEDFSNILHRSLINEQLWIGVDNPCFKNYSNRLHIELFLLRAKCFKLLYYLFKIKEYLPD